jgi:hypothetical protein
MRRGVQVAKFKPRPGFVDPDRGPLVTPRLVVCLLLMVVGIAWIVWYYTAVRVDPNAFPPPKPGSPHFMAQMHRWNYLVGFALFFLGLLLSAHPTTPLGRDRGVVVGMLACFLLGLVWICTFYVVSGTQLPKIPVFNDLGQYNLLIGIGFMAVGFSFATRWE